MSCKHIKATEAATPLDTVSLTDLCHDVLREVLAVVHAQDAVSLSIQPFVCRMFGAICAIVQAAVPKRPPYVDKHVGGEFVRQAFADGDLTRLHWAHRHGVCTRARFCLYPTPTQGSWPPRGGSFPNAFGTTLSPFDAAAAFHTDGHADSALLWYLDSFFFPALAAIPRAELTASTHTRMRCGPVEAATSQTGPVTCVSHIGSELIREAAIRDRFDLVERLVESGCQLCNSDRRTGLRASESAASTAFFAHHSIIGEEDPDDDEDFIRVVHYAAANGNIPKLYVLLRAAGIRLPADAKVDAAIQHVRRHGCHDQFTSTRNTDMVQNLDGADEAGNAAANSADDDDSEDDSRGGESAHDCAIQAYVGAAEGGQAVTLSWLYANLSGGVPRETLQQAVTYARMDAAQWAAARMRRCVVEQWEWFWYETDDGVGDHYPAETGAVLDWLLQHYPPLTDDTANGLVRRAVACAAGSLQLSILVVLHRRGFSVDYMHVWNNLGWRSGYTAALMAAITWLLRHVPAATPDLFVRAARKRRFAIVFWLRDLLGIPGYDNVADAVVSYAESVSDWQRAEDGGPIDDHELLAVREAEEIVAGWDRM